MRCLPLLLLTCAVAGTAVRLGAQAGILASPPLWNDEFHQAAGSSPDPAKWVFDLGADGWGNHELERYVSDPANCSVVDDAEASDGKALAIRAIRDGSGFTSARIKTKGRYFLTYGRVEARMKLTQGQGIWPAFWLLAERVDAVGWPAGGEIDIMENIGSRPGLVYGTIHGPGYSGKNGIQASHALPGNIPYSRGYHVFAVDWTPGVITWSIDGHPYQTLTPASLPAGKKWVYDDSPFFIILNLAVGGGWPGNPDATTLFPQTLLIDYVRVYAPVTRQATQ